MGIQIAWSGEIILRYSVYIWGAKYKPLSTESTRFIFFAAKKPGALIQSSEGLLQGFDLLLSCHGMPWLHGSTTEPVMGPIGFLVSLPVYPSQNMARIWWWFRTNLWWLEGTVGQNCRLKEYFSWNQVGFTGGLGLGKGKRFGQADSPCSATCRGQPGETRLLET
jgi:hypothetical protein